MRAQHRQFNASVAAIADMSGLELKMNSDEWQRVSSSRAGAQLDPALRRNMRSSETRSRQSLLGKQRSQ
jgi:hypothetical protein